LALGVLEGFGGGVALAEFLGEDTGLLDLFQLGFKNVGALYFTGHLQGDFLSFLEI
jgi:hypothetical protein